MRHRRPSDESVGVDNSKTLSSLTLQQSWALNREHKFWFFRQMCSKNAKKSIFKILVQMGVSKVKISHFWQNILFLPHECTTDVHRLSLSEFKIAKLYLV